jgi:hypothetical protein
VLLSSVRLMAAFGGKSVNGVLKLRKPERYGLGGEPGRDVLAAAAAAAAVVVGAADANEPIERQKRKSEAARNRTRMAILGGRMVSGVRGRC